MSVKLDTNWQQYKELSDLLTILTFLKHLTTPTSFNTKCTDILISKSFTSDYLFSEATLQILSANLVNNAFSY